MKTLSQQLFTLREKLIAQNLETPAEQITALEQNLNRDLSEHLSEQFEQLETNDPLLDAVPIDIPGTWKSPHGDIIKTSKD